MKNVNTEQEEMFRTSRQVTVSDTYDATADVVLFNGGCDDLLKNISSNSVDLVITSPPYNIGKKYEKKTSLQSYLKSLEPAIAELNRVLASTGSLCWQVGNYVHNGEVFPLDIYFYEIFKCFDLKLRNRIIWRFGHGLHCSKRFSGRYEVILWFTKSDDYISTLIQYEFQQNIQASDISKVRKRGNRQETRLARILLIFGMWSHRTGEDGVWDIPNVKANHPEKTEHPCQFPVELVQRCVLALTDADGIVLDPYCGVGSTIIAALQHNRKAIAAEQDSTYVDITRDRLQRFAHGKLPLRPLGKPIHKPTGKERIAQMPLEWK